MGILSIVLRFKKKSVTPKEGAQFPACFISLKSETKIPMLYYQTDAHIYSVDGNSNVRLHQKIGNVHNSDLLESAHAEEVKKEIAKFYQSRNRHLPKEFYFLKTYSSHVNDKHPQLKS